MGGLVFERGDRVRTSGSTDEWVIVGTRADDLFEIQRGNDGASKRVEKATNLELIAKPSKAESEPRFVPGRSITDVGY
jgi:hypothetical protein